MTPAEIQLNKPPSASPPMMRVPDVGARRDARLNGGRLRLGLVEDRLDRHPILRRHDGRRLDPRTAHRRVQSIGRHAGLNHLHPHMLRAAFIMAALDAGVPIARRANGRPSRRTPNQHHLRPPPPEHRPPRRLRRGRLRHQRLSFRIGCPRYRRTTPNMPVARVIERRRSAVPNVIRWRGAISLRPDRHTPTREGPGRLPRRRLDRQMGAKLAVLWTGRRGRRRTTR
jgi:hypothetical protein